MKKRTFNKIFAMLIMASALTFTFSSCEKDNNDPANQQQGVEEPAVLTAQDLAGTSWLCSMQNSTVYQGIAMDVSFDGTLDFLDTENGEQFWMVSIEIPAYPAANQTMDETWDFTYTVNGNKILITEYYTDENGEEASETTEYVYDAATQTITHDTEDPDMQAMMGTTVYTFTKIQ